MKPSTVLACLLFSVPLLAGDSPLKNVSTVFIDSADVRVRRDIQRALKSELPQVRVVTHERDADAVIEFSGRSELVSTASRVNVEVLAPGIQDPNSLQMRTISVPASEGTSYDAGYEAGSVVTRDGATTVIHDGFPGDFFARQFAARFIAAWRQANR